MNTFFFFGGDVVSVEASFWCGVRFLNCLCFWMSVSLVLCTRLIMCKLLH